MENKYPITYTEDYSIFKMSPFNRPVDEAHVRNLQVSISKRNMLEIFPVILNEHFIVVDGQHRLEAAKRNKLPVPYRIVDGLTEDDMVLINADNKRWGVENYVHFYAQKGLSDYIILEEFMNKHDLSARISSHILVGQARHTKGEKNGGSLQTAIKTGKLKIVKVRAERADDLVRKLYQIRQYCGFSALSFTPFISSIEALIALGAFFELLEPLKRSGDLIEKQQSSRQFLREYERYVNKGKRKDKTYLRLF